MAKRARTAAGAASDPVDIGSTMPTTEERLGDFAEDLGRFLGTTQAKAAAWLDQRKQLLDNLVQVRDTATHYIEQLGGSAPASRGRRPGPGQPGTGEGRPKKGRPRKKRTMSAEARAKIGAAQRARWARQRKEK